MYRRILVPVDGSPCGERAAATAVAFAARLGAGVVFTFVLRERYARMPSSEEAGQRARALGQALLERWERDGSDLPGGAGSRFVEGGDVAATIVQTAHSESCDLVCMGTHGREGLPRLLLGSVAERITRLAGVPVLLDRGAADRPRTLQRIVVAVDGSEPSLLAARHAVGLARSLGAALTLLHVVPEAPLPLDVMGVYVDAAEESVGRARQAGQELLDGTLARFPNLVATTRLIDAGGSRVGDAIARAAAEDGADLIVLGTHGRSGLDHLLLGSVAER
ncbi:MAG TPA: universal stress protein, partial [Deinococcales bacterium]|nr:universal stress protein [Deinococcales bacterium]